MIKYTLFIILFISSFCFGQNKKEVVFDSAFTTTYWDAVSTLELKKIDSLLNFAKQKLNTKEHQAKFNYYNSEFLNIKGKHLLAFKEAQKSREYFIDVSNLLYQARSEVTMINSIGHLNYADYEVINLDKLIESVCKIGYQIDDYILISNCEYSQSVRASFLKNYNKALKHDLNLSEIALEAKDTSNYMRGQMCLSTTLGYQLKYQQAITILNKVENYYKKENNTYDLFYVYMNKCELFGELNELENALINVKKAQKIVKQFHNVELERWVISELSEIYDRKGDYKKSLELLKTENELFDSLSYRELSQKVSEIKIKYETDEKNETIKDLSTYKNSLQNQLNSLFPVIGILSFITLLLFFFYKKYYKKTEALEEEKQMTSKKIDELKKIVIKNHIVLKDKTKIYIADLVYVKSDDHYLNVFLSDGKNHFVRGTLNSITKELPPNFIRCHRSYIINSNFIKQINNTTITLINSAKIPLSRTYKDNF